jgi:hypothetical protein
MARALAVRLIGWTAVFTPLLLGACAGSRGGAAASQDAASSGADGHGSAPLPTADALGGVADRVLDEHSDSAPAPLIECRPDAQTVSIAPGKVGLRERVAGSNGAFEDRCDASGNLVEYVCEVNRSCGPGPNPACSFSYSGRVQPRLQDCAGQCRGGACDDLCPTMGRTVVFESASGAGYLAVRDEGDGQRYACTVASDTPGDTFDCLKDLRAGGRARIDGTGSGGSCAAAFSLSVTAQGVAPSTQSHCTLQCRRGGGELRVGEGMPAVVTACPAAGESAPGYSQPALERRGRLRGSNGEFEDTCTTSGNLVEQLCEAVFDNGLPRFRYTGNVIAQLHDCGGACRAGACAIPCPEAGQTVVYESADGTGVAVLRNEAEGRRYACTVERDEPSDQFDCTTGARVGLRGRITDRPARPTCTVEVPSLGVSVEGQAPPTACPACPHCRLACRVVP